MDSVIEKPRPEHCSSESEDSERLVIVEEPEESGGSPAPTSVKGNTENRKHSYEEYKKICVKDFILKKLTYYKLKRLMALYNAEISEKNKKHRRRCLTSWKTAKVMSKTLLMFHLMFEELKENITLNSIYYQQMSDLISIYIDFEIKASEVGTESAGTLSSRVTFIMEKCLDHQHRFTLDTLLKSHNICNKFQEISTLLISRVIRGLPSTNHSEQSFVRAMLVFKLWIQIADVEERTKILKLASHLAKPPKELLKEPSKLAKDVLPCNFLKCYIDLTTYIIGTPWPLRKKIKIFLEHTRIVETCHHKESISKSPDNTEEKRTVETADIKALKEIQYGLQKIILWEKKQKQIIRRLKTNHYKYAPIEELSQKVPHSLEYLKVRRKDAYTQTRVEPNEELSFSHTKVIHECINELFKRMVGHTNVEPIQNQGRDRIDLQHDKIFTEITDLPNNARIAEFPQGSVPKEVSNLFHADSTAENRMKTIILDSDSNTNIPNNDVAIMEVDKQNKKGMEDEIVSTISIVPAASISNNFENKSSKAIADWHTPEIHSQSKRSTSNPFLQSYGLQTTSGLMNRPTETIQTNTVPTCVASTLFLPPETSSNTNYEQSNPYVDLVRSTDSLLPTNSCLPPSRSDHLPESNLTVDSPRTLLNRRAILRSSHINDSNPGCRDDKLFVRDTTVKYYPPLAKNNMNAGSFNQVQGNNSDGCARDRYYPMHQPYPMLFDQYNSRPHCSQGNAPLSFYDNNTIANSGPQIMGREYPNLTDPNSLVANGVGTLYPQPLYLPSGNNDERTFRTNQTRRGRGSGNTSAVQRSNRRQAPDKPQTSIAVNSNNNLTVQNWPNGPMQEHYNSFRTLDGCIPNSSSPMMLKPPVPTSNIIQYDPKLSYAKLPPYSSIRRKDSGFDPAQITTDSPSNSLPLNTVPNCFPVTNAPIAVPVTSSQRFPPANNNSSSLSVLNTVPSSAHANASLSRPVSSASTSFSVPLTPAANSEVMRSDNNYSIQRKDITPCPLDLYNHFFNMALNKAIFILTHKNDFGFVEYNFKKISFKVLKDALNVLEEISSNNNAIDAVDRIIALLSQTNENFINDKNMIPPQLLKVNCNDINKDKHNIAERLRKQHEATLYSDQLASDYQEKVRNFYHECNYLPQDDFMAKPDLQFRCYCLQCCANKIVLGVNYAILRHFRHYQISRSSVHSKENEKSQPLRKAGVSKRSLEDSVKERDSPLPLKKRITSTPPNEARFTKDSEVSYPSTPMISIAELELFKDNSTKMKDRKTDSVKGIAYSTSGAIPNSVVESKSSEISKNISSEVTFHALGSEESTIMSANNIDNFSNVRTGQNLSSSEVIQSSAAIQSRKLQEKSGSKKSLGRSRKNARK